jgi:hypothetical protein
MEENRKAANYKIKNSIGLIQNLIIDFCRKLNNLQFIECLSTLKADNKKVAEIVKNLITDHKEELDLFKNFYNFLEKIPVIFKKFYDIELEIVIEMCSNIIKEEIKNDEKKLVKNENYHNKVVNESKIYLYNV